jgi:hypothetical protein
MATEHAILASTLQIAGAAGFGIIIGWYIYYINRYRKGDVQFSDLTTVVGTIGGAAVLGLFPSGSDLFGGYGIGLFVGFFAYFLVLIILVKRSNNFDSDWFLDGRRRDVQPGYVIPSDVRPSMAMMEAPQAQNATIAAAAAAGAVAAALGRGAHVGDAGMAEAVPGAGGGRAVIDACEAQWDANKVDCNAFVIAVASQFGITLTGNADNIVNQMLGPGWTAVPDGAKAKTLAEAGMLVLAGLKGNEHAPARALGHVAVVTAGPLAFNHYPTGYWGSMDGIPAKARTLNWAWRQEDRDRVHYAARTI